jgi:hypothetical protein
MTNATGPEDLFDSKRIPVCITGIVTRTEMDYCMDEAPFQLHHHPSAITRIVPTTDSAREYLDRIAGSRQRVAVCGYVKHGPECSNLQTYYAGPVEHLISSLQANTAKQGTVTG